MKKWKVILSLFLILIFVASPGLAAKKNNSMTISMDGRKYTIKEVPVVMDGQAVYSDIPTFIHPANDYTLVPIRFIAERYGAEVGWEQKTKTVTLIQGNKEIKMSIGSKDLYVNGEKRALEGNVTPKLVTFPNEDSRTMVPLRIISETLGYEVGWDNINKVPYINTRSNEDIDNTDDIVNAREITNINIEKGSTNKPKIMIKGTQNLNYSTILLENPNRLVIDIEDAKLNIKDNILFEDGVGNIYVNHGPVNKISVSQFSTTPDTVRITVHLTEKADFDIVSLNEGKILNLSFVNKVGKIEKEFIDGQEALVVYTSDKLKTNIINLKNPERIVVDLMDAFLEGGDYFDYDYELGFIKRVRVSQFEPDNLYKPNDRIVRLVLDIKEGILDPNVKIHTYNDRIVIIPETSIWEVLNYSLEGASRIISINANKETDYYTNYDKDSKTMTIDIPSNNIDLKEGYVDLRDGLINDITVRKSGDNIRITIRFRRSIDYTLLSNIKANKIKIKFKRDENIKTSDMLIIVDPGHGGHDPGTVQNGTREKDINLAVSLKLNESLMNKGYSTIMTREDDTFIDLPERARIANDYQGDLFISIHSNSAADSNVSGIQVLYHSKDKPNVNKEDTLALAKIMMDEITKGTGAADKGLLPRERTVVIRDTSMPSVLIELGFLTNPEEVKLLNDSKYQDLLVESIIKGIEKYLEIYY